jgi:16S rRNA (adenine1518-N6/adenine1519-N6)-dimethyltransferase
MYKKKSLGQHFLHSQAYLNAVADAAHIQEGEVVLEIGPGEGALTAVLLERGAKVVAIEKDARLIPLLTEKFANKPFTVIETDALEFDTADLKTKKFKVVGNVPYYITGALFKKFLSCNPQPTTLVFLIQKEVAERIARTKKESILSLSVKAYGTPHYIKTVPAGAFSPPPKVDSAILAVLNVSRQNFTSPAHEERFFEAVKKGFAQKRKFLKNNLGAEFAEAFERSGLTDKVRAEDVPLAKYLTLSRS